MATNMDALLRVVTQVTGAEKVSALQGAFAKVEGAAKGLTSNVGLLGGALGALAPVVTVGGLVALVGKTIEAGKQMYELSQQTGVSVEMLGKFKKAAGMTGVDMDTVASAFVKLGRSMYLAASQSGFAGKTKEEIENSVQAVKDGERRQTEIVKEQADNRITALEKETDKRLKEISKRYKIEERLLNDSFDDARDAEDQAAQKETDRLVKQINRRYEARRKEINDNKFLSDDQKTYALQRLQDQEDEELSIVRDGAARKSKERHRAIRDDQQMNQDALDRKREAEENAVKRQSEIQKKAIKENADFREEQIKRVADAAEKALKKDTGAQDLGQEMQDLGLSGKKASVAFHELNISIKNADGSLRDKGEVMLELATKLGNMKDKTRASGIAMDILGKSGYKMLPIFALGGAAIQGFTSKLTTLTAKELKQYSVELTKLSGKIAGIGIDLTKALLPALSLVASGVGKVVEFFMKMPEPIRAISFIATTLAVGFTAVAAALAPFAFLLTSLISTGALAVITDLFTTLVGVIFSWPVALVAAGVAIFIFRDKIYSAVDGINKSIQGTIKTIFDLFVFDIALLGRTVYGAADNLNKGIQGVIGSIWEWAKSGIKNIADALARPFQQAAAAIKGVVNNILSFCGNAINSFIDGINSMIVKVNSISGRIGIRLGTFGHVPVPQFASGAYVTGATTATVGEAGPEYVIPAARMGAASRAYLQGSRGVDVVNGAGGSAAAPTINITTGQVVQMPDGSQWVSMADLEQAMHATAAGIMGQLRTPAGRIAMGGA